MTEDELGLLIGNIFGWIGTVLSVYFFLAPAVPFYKLLYLKVLILGLIIPPRY